MIRFELENEAKRLFGQYRNRYTHAAATAASLCEWDRLSHVEQLCWLQLAALPVQR